MNKEQQILQQIRLNPYISQQELSTQIGISRPAVANYIKKLIEAGEIKGRAYILNEQPVVTCIGGANIDRKAYSLQKVRMQTSNPVTTQESLGGVARNVAENLAQLNLQPHLSTFVGADKEGDWIKESSQDLGIDTSQIITIPESRTGTYTAFLNEDGELVVSMADMEIYNHVSTNMLEAKWKYISHSSAIFVDTNIPQESLEMLIHKCALKGIALFLDPVSSIKAEKLPHDLSGIHTIFPNKDEAETLSGISISSEADYPEACRRITSKGVNQVILSLGEKGIYYYSDERHGLIPSKNVDVVDVTGAGDAFAAGFIYGFINNQTLKETCKLGMASALLTLQSSQSCTENLHPNQITQLAKEF
ncbi:carbohydrate kinase [Halalkalibacillus halophilus]|uniref:carbohydrate kinase n=1 Tax=Halalkalibacillus halophilus TaxID=392827 RepID=UPI00041A00EF|nr:carbohydrate kinase [Halalkalibacillus halophilus]